MEEDLEKISESRGQVAWKCKKCGKITRSRRGHSCENGDLEPSVDQFFEGARHIGTSPFVTAAPVASATETPVRGSPVPTPLITTPSHPQNNFDMNQMFQFLQMQQQQNQENLQKQMETQMKREQ